MTDPAGVQGADQTAATLSIVSSPPSAGPSCSGTLASRAATAEEPKPEAATLATVSSPHLLLLKLEVITALYKNKNGSHYEDQHQVYRCEWAAELGQ